MKFNFILLVLSSLFVVSCGPSPEEVFADDTATIIDYLTTNSLIDSASVTASGIYYIIDKPGNSTIPSLNSNVECNYYGYFPNGESFDSGISVPFTLGATIEGWRQGIPLIGEGGTIHLYIPSVFCYGETGNSNIEKNEVLFFDVDLIKVN